MDRVSIPKRFENWVLILYWRIVHVIFLCSRRCSLLMFYLFGDIEYRVSATFLLHPQSVIIVIYISTSTSKILSATCIWKYTTIYVGSCEIPFDFINYCISVGNYSVPLSFPSVCIFHLLFSMNYLYFIKIIHDFDLIFVRKVAVLWIIHLWKFENKFLHRCLLSKIDRRFSGNLIMRLIFLNCVACK